MSQKCATEGDAQAVTCLIFLCFFLHVVQAPNGVLRAVTCCARGWEERGERAEVESIERKEIRNFLIKKGLPKNCLPLPFPPSRPAPGPAQRCAVFCGALLPAATRPGSTRILNWWGGGSQFGPFLYQELCPHGYFNVIQRLSPSHNFFSYFLLCHLFILINFCPFSHTSLAPAEPLAFPPRSASSLSPCGVPRPPLMH